MKPQGDYEQEYHIYISVEEEAEYAISTENVEIMNMAKENYANEVVPDTVKIEAYRVKDVVVAKNEVTSFTFIDDVAREIRVNILEPLLLINE